jgi:hypothetical protein
MQRKQTCAVLVGLVAILTFGSSAMATLATDVFPVGHTGLDFCRNEVLGAERLLGLDLGLFGYPLGKNLGGTDSTIADSLARLASYGFWCSGNMYEFEMLKDWTDTLVNDTLKYKQRYTYPTRYLMPNPFHRYVADSVALIVDWLKDSDGYHRLVNYWTWDEPFEGYHSMDDSIGVYTIMKWYIEHTEPTSSVRPVWTHGDHHAIEIGLDNWFDLHFTDTLATTCGNAPYHVSGIAPFPFYYPTRIAEPSEMIEFGATIDTIADAGKAADQGLTPTWEFIQAFGQSDSIISTDQRRIPTPEEMRCLVNLAILHESKGVTYFLSTTIAERESLTGFTDQHYTPFDAPYEEYVYEREHALHWSPDSLRPFNPNDTLDIRDPFRGLGTRPNPAADEKGWERYYTWKYGPYGRNLRNLGRSHAPVHRMKDVLLPLWDADSVLAEISPADSCAEIITFSDDPDGGIGQDSPVYLFFVSKDFWNGDTLEYGKWTFTVCVDTLKLPSRFHPVSTSCKPLDIEERRVRSWYGQPQSGHKDFRVQLTSGQGKLVELVTGSEVRDFTVADPDIYFTDPPDTSEPDSVRYFLGVFAEDEDFVEGETAELCAKVFNIGFTSCDSVVVIFYDGDPRGSLALIGCTVVALPALTGTDSSMAIAHLPFYLKAGTAGPHDIHVVVNHQYVLTDAGTIPNYYISERDSANNHAHAPLYVYPLDYATEELENPWDMDEDTTLTWDTPDIYDVTSGVLDPDSITGVAELHLEEAMPEPDTMHVFLQVGEPYHYIEPDSFTIFQARIFVSANCSLQVFWYDDYHEEKRSPTYPNPIPLEGGEWNLVEQDLTEYPSTWLETLDVNRFGFVIMGTGQTRVRASWVKLIQRLGQ